MLTVQTMISSVEADVKNGSSQRRYHGNTAGAHKRDAAMGQANWSGDHSGASLLSQVAVTNPTSTASPANNCGGATRSSTANTGPLKRKALHIRTKRADRNAAVIKKWHVQESDHNCRQRSVANANPLPVEGQEYDRQKFHRDS